jgi:hypothetical protein
MSTPERHEQPPLPYYQAARFPGERPAGRVYSQLQAAVFARTDCNLSVYRLLLDGLPHVTVLGQPPPADLQRRVTRLLGRGEPATLPAAVLQVLAERRAAAMQEAPWVERHHRPGERL